MGRPGIRDFRKAGNTSPPFTVLTAYDAPTARILSGCGVTALLVGDSLGNVVLGYRDPVPVTLDEMLHHCCAVRRGAPDAFVIGDLPFLTYQVSDEAAVENAGRLVKEGLVDAVKLEGGHERSTTVARIVAAGIPVMGHLGLTPQSATLLGGYRAQATTADSARTLVESALALQDAGCFSIVLECVPKAVAEKVTHSLEIATIGIGAGSRCDGQVLVVHDLLGIGGGFQPKFVRRYAELESVIADAVSRFVADVASGGYPSDAESFSMKEKEERRFRED